MAKRIVRTGKRSRPKTAIKGKRFRCAICHKRSPKPVKTAAPWYCPNCKRQLSEEQSATEPAQGNADSAGGGANA